MSQTGDDLIFAPRQIAQTSWSIFLSVLLTYAKVKCFPHEVVAKCTIELLKYTAGELAGSSLVLREQSAWTVGRMLASTHYYNYTLLTYHYHTLWVSLSAKLLPFVLIYCSLFRHALTAIVKYYTPMIVINNVA